MTEPQAAEQPQAKPEQAGTKPEQAGTKPEQAGTKPGYKSTEFWITVGLGIAGAILMATGKQELGTALLAAAGISYNGARGLAKFK